MRFRLKSPASQISIWDQIVTKTCDVKGEILTVHKSCSDCTKCHLNITSSVSLLKTTLVSGDESNIFTIKCIELAYAKKTAQRCCGDGYLGDLFWIGVPRLTSVSNYFS